MRCASVCADCITDVLHLILFAAEKSLFQFIYSSFIALFVAYKRYKLPSTCCSLKMPKDSMICARDRM